MALDEENNAGTETNTKIDNKTKTETKTKKLMEFQVNVDIALQGLADNY